MEALAALAADVIIFESIMEATEEELKLKYKSLNDIDLINLHGSELTELASKLLNEEFEKRGFTDEKIKFLRENTLTVPKDKFYAPVFKFLKVIGWLIVQISLILDFVYGFILLLLGIFYIATIVPLWKLISVLQILLKALKK